MLWFLTLEQRPSLNDLLKFPCKGRSVNIITQIGANYARFGILLLNDEMGTKLTAITIKHKNDAKQINMEILLEWLQGRGKIPVTWQTLVEVLQDTGLAKLAKDIFLLFSSGARGEAESAPSKPQIKDVMDALNHSVADKWQMIGAYLEVPKGTLEEIAEKHQHDPHKCLLKMLEIHPPTSWTTIIKAMEFLGEEQLGRELTEKYVLQRTGLSACKITGFMNS